MSCPLILSVPFPSLTLNDLKPKLVLFALSPSSLGSLKTKLHSLFSLFLADVPLLSMVYLKVRNHLSFLSKTLVWLFVCFCLRCVCVLFLCAVECESSCATPAAVQARMYHCKHYFASSNYFRMILLYFWSCESCLVFWQVINKENDSWPFSCCSPRMK